MHALQRFTPHLSAAFALSALSLTPLAHAAEAPAEAARAHIAAIAAGHVDAITASYGPDAVLEWVGGPLDGRYAAADAIKTTWTKFTKANGPLTATPSRPMSCSRARRRFRCAMCSPTATASWSMKSGRSIPNSLPRADTDR